jgi:predicted ATPase
MRINKISIENFKCLKSVDIETGKLTLLTGANSSGKSSILYGILGPLQSGEFPFQFSPNGKYVNMGNFQEMSYRHIRENIIKIGLEITEGKNPINLSTWWEEDKVRKLPTLNKLVLDGEVYKIEIVKTKNYTLNFRISSDKYPEEKFWWLNQSNLKYLELSANLTQNVEFNLDNFDDLKKKSISQDVLLDSILWSLGPLFNRLDEKINYINSFRLFPERTYYETTKMDLTVGKFGEDYVNQVISWQTQGAKEYKDLIKIMRNLSLLEEIKSKRLEGGRFELVVKVNKKSVPCSLNDVGFGISQFLPIIVADLQLGEESTLFVAQPEIHLHPSVQADFGTYMINQVTQSQKNYIIETHSEYLLNRIRLAVVKGDIPKEDVKIFYLKNDGEDVQTYQLEFTADGQILNAPEDFFKTYQMDVMNIAISAAGE